MRVRWGMLVTAGVIAAACGGGDDAANLGSKVGSGGVAGVAGAGGGSDASSGGSAGNTPSGGTGGVAGASGAPAGGTAGGGTAGVAGSPAGGAGGADGGPVVSPWANYYGTTAADSAIGLGTDAASNVYVALLEQNGFDFGQGIVGGFNLVKLHPNGALDWYVSIPTAGAAGALTVDASGNVVYVGDFAGGITLGNTTIIGGNGMFAVRYSSNKTLLASKVWPHVGPSGNGSAVAVTTDASNAVVFAVEMGQGSIDFGNGPVSGQSKDAIVKLDSALATQWTTEGVNARVRSLQALGNGEIAFVGWGTGTASFGGASVNTKNGTDDFLIGRLSSSGSQTMLKAFGGSGSETIIAGTAAANGSTYVVGAFTGTVDFGGGALQSTPNPPNGGDPFVAGFDGAGNHLFSKFIATGYEHAFTRVAIGPTNRLHVTGAMSGSVDYGTGQLSSGGGLDALLLELSSTNGTALRARRWGADGQQYLVNVSPTTNGDVVLAVSDGGTLDLGGGPIVCGTIDPFVALLPP